MNRACNYVAGILSLCLAYELAQEFGAHEKAWGLYCEPKICGPDDLPFWVFVIAWAALYALYAKLRGDNYQD